MISSRKRSHSDMGSQWPHSKLVDEDAYRANVLQLPPGLTEDDLDEKVTKEAQALGLLTDQVTPDIEDILAAFSATTISFNPNSPNSLSCQSPPPTSRSSSEQRPVTQSSVISEKSPPRSETPSVLSTDVEKKRGSGFRRGIRKMSVFTKRRSIPQASSTVTSINGDTAHAHQSDQTSIRSELKSPASIKSSKSSWSSPLSAAKSSYEHTNPIVDHEALRRSSDCIEIQNLRGSQVEERSRFLDFQRSLFDALKTQRRQAKSEKSIAHRQVVDELEEKCHEKTIEEIENRQLDDEMKMKKEHELEKRSVMIRLRHMEAYCQNPTPPPTPRDPISGRLSMETPLPERKVTEKDYHNLAQQYRERDAMDTLHAAKINVLRGKQKKAVEKSIRKKEREIYELEKQLQSELDTIDHDFITKEDNLRQALAIKRSRLEMRWRTVSLIERTKAERATGLKHAPLADIVAREEHGIAIGVA